MLVGGGGDLHGIRLSVWKVKLGRLVQGLGSNAHNPKESDVWLVSRNNRFWDKVGGYKYIG
jgi:hypothetical protein